MNEKLHSKYSRSAQIQPTETCVIWDIPTTAQTFPNAVSRLLKWSQAKNDTLRYYVSTCPVYTLMQGVDHPHIAQALQDADMVAADGMPVVWLQQRKGHPHAQRVYGPDLMLALCDKGRYTPQPVRHLFYGGGDNVAVELASSLEERFPGMQTVGTISPPMLSNDNLFNQTTVEQLNAIDADVIWVGLGSPKQDLWMQAYRPHLHAPLLIGVGAAFDFLSNRKPQAPIWMQKRGLEWAFRLAKEPRRLGRRYVVYNSRFLWRLLWNRT